MPTKNEKQNKKLIRTIAEIVILSIPRHDVDTIDKGIRSLENIAMKFLQNTTKNSQRFQIVEKNTFHAPDEIQNQYISYICEELLRIFKVAVEDRDSYASKQVIQSYRNMLTTALRQPDNQTVLKLLFEHEERYGSLHWQLLDFAIENNAKEEKFLLLQILKEIFNLFLRDKDCKPYYINEFMTIHIFRIFQLIIDKDDFESFVKLLGYNSVVVRGYNIYDNFLGYSYQSGGNDEAYQQIQKISDILEYQFKKDHTLTNKNKQLERLTVEFDKMKKLLIRKGIEKNVIERKINEFFKEFNRIYIQSSNKPMFFAVGAYLLHKGERYSYWLSEMWYFTKPEYSNITYGNEVPTIRDPLSQICLAMYEENSSKLGLRIELGKFYDAVPYLYQYAILSMLRDDKRISFPSNNEIAEWKREKRTIPIMFWYEILSLLQIDKLTSAMNTLKPKFISAIRGEDLDICKRIDKLKENLERLKNSQKSQKEELELCIDVSQILIEKRIKAIKNHYKKESQIPSLACIDKSAANEFKKIEIKTAIPRGEFIEQEFMEYHNIEDTEITDKEQHYLHKILSEHLQDQELDFNLETVKLVIQNMKIEGYNPNVIFVSSDMITKIVKEWNKWFSSSQFIEIDHEKLRLVHFNDRPFSTIIIYDKKYLKIAYKNEIDVQVSNIDKKEVVFISSVDMSIKISDPKAFVHISLP